MAHWAPLDRHRGESRDHWLERNHDWYIEQWKQDKKDRGEWDYSRDRKPDSSHDDE